MRLIDADKLIEELNDAIKRKGLNAEAKNRASWCACFLDLIAQTSTVEAIPIRWLKRWSSSQVASYFDDEVLFKIRYKPIILHAIEDWEHKRGEWE